MSKKGGEGGPGVVCDGGRTRITRSEFNDDVMRDNVRIVNKHQRELRVHERAKNVVTRNIDRDAQIFKQKQASQKTKLPGLNSQGHKKRLSSTANKIKIPDSTNWIPDFKVSAMRQESISSKNGTLSPLTSVNQSDRISPLSPLTPRSDQGQYHYNSSDELPKIRSGRSSTGQSSPEVILKSEVTSCNKATKRSPTELTSTIDSHRHLTGVNRIEHIDEGTSSTRSRTKSATKGMYFDGGNAREETVFDLLSKPKYNYELLKKKDIRIRLEKEFTPRKTTKKLDVLTNKHSKKEPRG